jgi:hypothetical protein
MRKTAFLLLALVMTGAAAQQKLTTGYAPVHGLKMYYEIHGKGEPVVLLSRLASLISLRRDLRHARS